MAKHRLEHVSSALGLALSLLSCRSILDITPGRPLEDAASGSGGNTGGGKGSARAGTDATGDGGGDSTAGGDTTTAGTGHGGKSSQGGTSTTGGSKPGDTNDAGAGGEPSTPPDPFPDGPCRACLARDCPTERSNCIADSDCSQSVPEWLECTAADANACITSEPGPLQELETCGAQSCDVCRHLTDGEPSIEILTPSNGAVFQLDATGKLEISVRVQNITLAELGSCGTDTNCGHIHLNLDGENCRKFPFYNEWIVKAEDGYAGALVDTTACKTSIFGRPLALTASLSTYNTHADRVPLVQATVMITINE